MLWRAAPERQLSVFQKELLSKPWGSISNIDFPSVMLWRVSPERSSSASKTPSLAGRVLWQPFLIAIPLLARYAGA